MKVVFAKRGKLETDRENNRLLMHIYDARFEQRDDQNPTDLTKLRQGITMQQSTWPISLEELYQKNQKRRGLSSMTVGELMSRSPALEGKDAKKAAGERAATLTEVNKRFSFSLASLAFALIGVPLAITAHRKETSIGFLLSVVIAFVYFFFIILADTLRNKPGAHPELLVWAPNVLFLAIGAWLFVRLARR
jgi:lipopolysaccharide export system permease protein